jgi:thiol-disulfide isomerase/thioredoxin
VRSLIIITSILCFSFTVPAQKIPAWKITDLETYIHQSPSPVIISFWATFCKPCLEEIPYFEEMVKKYNREGVTLLLVSLDLQEQYPKDISTSISLRKFSSAVVWLNETNADYFCPKVDSAWSGSLPSSLFINNKTGYHKFFEEQVPRGKLEKEIKAMIGVESSGQ